MSSAQVSLSIMEEVRLFLASRDNFLPVKLVPEDAASRDDAPVLSFGPVRCQIDFSNPQYFKLTSYSLLLPNDSVTSDHMTAFLSRLRMFLDYEDSAITTIPRAVLLHASHLYLLHAAHALTEQRRLSSLESSLAAIPPLPPRKCRPDSRLSAVMGAFWGLVIGAAAGSTLDGFCRPPSPQDISAALLLPGGYVSRRWIAPGEPSFLSRPAISAFVKLSSGITTLSDLVDVDSLIRAGNGSSVDTHCAALLLSCVLGIAAAHNASTRDDTDQLAKTVEKLLSPLVPPPVPRAEQDVPEELATSDQIASACAGMTETTAQKEEDRSQALAAVSACCAVSVAVCVLVSDWDDSGRARSAADAMVDVCERVVRAEDARAAAASAQRLAGSCEDAEKAAGIPLMVFGGPMAAFCVGATQLLRSKGQFLEAVKAAAAGGGGKNVSVRTGLGGMFAGCAGGCSTVPRCLVETVERAQLAQFGAELLEGMKDDEKTPERLFLEIEDGLKKLFDEPNDDN